MARRIKEPKIARRKGSLDTRPNILIVCEGQNTEPGYFKMFRLASAKVEVVGTGYNTLSLVKRAIVLKNKHNYTQVWCVFDKDEHHNFNNAINKAKANGIKVAYSNQAFEYWFILHFDDHQGGQMHRSLYHKKINTILAPFKLTYAGKRGKIVSNDFYDLMMSADRKYHKKRVHLAIERAKRNYNKLDHTNPATEESSTTVFMLVEELLKYTPTY